MNPLGWIKGLTPKGFGPFSEGGRGGEGGMWDKGGGYRRGRGIVIEAVLGGQSILSVLVLRQVFNECGGWRIFV